MLPGVDGHADRMPLHRGCAPCPFTSTLEKIGNGGMKPLPGRTYCKEWRNSVSFPGAWFKN